MPLTGALVLMLSAVACDTTVVSETTETDSTVSGSQNTATTAGNDTAGSQVSADASNPDTEITNALNAGKLPDAYAYSDDGLQLLRGKSEVDDFYQLENVPNLYLNFDSDDWFNQLMDATNSGERVSATLDIDGVVFEQVGVRFRGNTSYQRSAERKSFDIELDTVNDDADIDGYNRINLNNAFEDPTYIREVFYLKQSRRHMSAAAANFANLYVNGTFWGIYSNVQELNRDFLKQWYLSKGNTNLRAGSSQPSGNTPAAGGMDNPADAGTRPEPPGGFPGGEQQPGGPQTGDTPDGQPTGAVAGQTPGMGGAQFADGQHGLDYLGEDPATYESLYELISTESDNPYAQMIPALRALDSVDASSVDTLREFLDVDQALWFLAHEILYGDDDSYINKGSMDYFITIDAATDRLIPYEYDGNSVMKMENAYEIFFREDNELFPLAQKLFAIPELRQRYLAHVRTLLRENFETLTATTLIDQLYFLVENGVAIDPHPHEGISYNGLAEAIDELKRFAEARYTLLTNDSDLAVESPVITQQRMTVNGSSTATVTDTDTPIVQASVSHSQGLTAVWLYIGTGLMGNFEKIAMQDDGAGDDTIAGDGVYTATLPPQVSGTYVRYYIEAVAADGADNFGTVSYLPAGAEHDVFIYHVPLAAEVVSPLVINELLASNETSMADEAGEFDDWVELKNTSDTDVTLNGLYLSDDPTQAQKWALPDITVSAGGYIGLWLDEDEEQGELHGNFKLSADGETLTLYNSNGQVLDSVGFTAQTTDVSYGRIPDGTGSFVFMAPSFERTNVSN